MVTRGPTCSSVSSKMPAHCTKLMEKVSTTYKLTDGVLVKVMHIIKKRDRDVMAARSFDGSGDNYQFGGF